MCLSWSRVFAGVTQARCLSASRIESPAIRSRWSATKSRVHCWSSGLLAQRPTDRLADPKALSPVCRALTSSVRLQVRVDRRAEECDIGGSLVRELADDRRAAQPQVVAERVATTRPGQHRRCDTLPVPQQDWRDVMGRDVVDVIPPRAGDDEVTEQGRQVGVVPPACRAVCEQGGCGIPLFAMGGVVPQIADGGLPMPRESRAGARRRREVGPGGP